MDFKNVWRSEALVNILKGGGVVVMPTDTLYGIVGNALRQDTVEKIYKTRKRNPEKPCIILIGETSELDKFGVALTEKQGEALEEYWPGPVSVILDCEDEKFWYLHRGTKTLAFRMPADPDLQNLLQKTGPLVAPSANPEDEPPATSIAEARDYFGDAVDLYIDGGIISGKASRVVSLESDGRTTVLRA